MKAPGFILIELLVSLLIASLLSIGMMSSLTMVFKTNEVMDSLMDTSAGAMRMQQQLERDLSGVFIPTSLLATATDMQATSTQAVQLGQNPATPAPKKESAEQKNKQLFFATKKDKNTEVLTFITTNPLASFWSDSAGQAQSRVVRVVYRLEPDKDNPPLFRLMRQEGMDLDFKNYASGVKKQVRALEVAKGIKAFSLSFMVEDEPEKKDKAFSDATLGKTAQGTAKPAGDVELKKTITYKTLDEWLGEEKKDKKDDKKSPKIPRFVRLKLTLLDAKKKREEDFEYIFSCACDVEPFAKKEVADQQKQPAVQGKPGGIRQRLAQASHKPKAMPGGLLGQFTQSLGVRV